MAKKSSLQLLAECQEGRKTVPAYAFKDVYGKLLDRDAALKDTQAGLEIADTNHRYASGLVEELRKKLEEANLPRLPDPRLLTGSEFTLRDRFAMAALVTLGPIAAIGEHEDTARLAYAIADGMLKGRG